MQTKLKAILFNEHFVSSCREVYESMRLLPLIQIVLLLATTLAPARAGAALPLDQQSISQLEERRDAMEAELEQLARFSLRSGTGAIGYRSLPQTTPNHPEWIEVDLSREHPIDEVVLVPALWRDSLKGFQADGFPVTFRILAGTTHDRSGTVLAEFNLSENSLQGIAPLVIPVKETMASWVRIEVSRLSRRSYDNKYILQFSEVLIFSGTENVALRKPVSVASVTHQRNDLTWTMQCLTDGFMPYLMDAAQGSPSLAYIKTSLTPAQPGDAPPTLSFDLGNEFPLSRIHLHVVDQSDTVPQGRFGEAGLPRHLKIEGATHPDFSDAVGLLEFKDRTLLETGPLMMWNIPETSCRFVRLIAIRSKDRPQIGFAEIELFANGKNVALGKPASLTFLVDYPDPDRSLAALTDGRNLYGNILPIRTWLHQLARRQAVERELPLLTAQLKERYARQQATVRWLGWLAVLLASGIVFTLLITRMLRMRQVARMKERFAADLHDELGASLHAIGLLGSHAKEMLESPEELAQTVDEITALSGRAATTTRYFSALQTSEEAHEDLLNDLQRAARRLIASLEYTFTVEGGEYLQSLKARSRSDLFLFFKEALVNINRHADATAVQIQLKADPQQINLRISDNGSGNPDSAEIELPPSLERRAKLLRAQVSVAPSTEGGTCITLLVRPRQRLHTSLLPTNRPTNRGAMVVDSQGCQPLENDRKQGG